VRSLKIIMSRSGTMVKMLRFGCLVRAMGLIRKLGSDYRLVAVERGESIAGVAMVETGYEALTTHSLLHLHQYAPPFKIDSRVWKVSLFTHTLT
jgi:hypothetical protein